MRRGYVLFTEIFLTCAVCASLVETVQASQEKQYVCQFKTKIMVADHSASTPKVQLHSVDEKYVFITNGNKGTYINLSFPAWKGPLIVLSDEQKVTVIEQNASDNLFMATIFSAGKNGLRDVIMSFHPASSEMEDFYPQQLYGKCS